MDGLQREQPWYEKWFDENYLRLYHHRDVDDARDQARLILDCLELCKDCSILDLGCGEGRYTMYFKRRGYRVLGLDLSEKLIRSGREKYPGLNLVVGDMRAIPGRFDLVLSLFTSFGYFEEDRENHRVVESVSGSLVPGGVFWLDFLNPTYIEDNLVTESEKQISSHTLVTEKRKIEDNRIIKDILFEEHGVKNKYKESVRLYSRLELEDMLKRAGLSIQGCFGNYLGAPWQQTSERTILYGKKP